MIFKPLSESLRIVIPIAVFVVFTIYLFTSDSSIVGPY